MFPACCFLQRNFNVFTCVIFGFYGGHSFYGLVWFVCLFYFSDRFLVRVGSFFLFFFLSFSL